MNAAHSAETAGTLTAGGPHSASDDLAQMVATEQEQRPREEMSAFYMGFGLGLMIGAFFLIYVVMAIAGWGG
jgi:hypothetical protein